MWLDCLSLMSVGTIGLAVAGSFPQIYLNVYIVTAVNLIKRIFYAKCRLGKVNVEELRSSGNLYGYSLTV